jgi:hypothetical protein
MIDMLKRGEIHVRRRADHTWQESPDLRGPPIHTRSFGS